MADDELIRLAKAHRIATHFYDWQGRDTEVPPDTIRAVLGALGVDASTPESVRTGRGFQAGAEAAARTARLPEERAWGLMTQLYSVRSRGSWGMGDLRDLADLAAWAGERLGAGFVLVNPLHAGEPAPPISPSPYLPMSRRFTSPLYLRVEDVPEYAALEPAAKEQVAGLGARFRNPAALLDRDAVWEAKREALELLYETPRTADRQRDYDLFRRREGQALVRFATWCALGEVHGADWRQWPPELRHPDSAAVAERAAQEELAARIDFHAWLQWQLDGQLAAAQRAAKAAGMPIGIVHDLAVGVHPGGADTWAYQDMFALGMSVGAPPDEFNQRGQGWGQPPWHPLKLAAAQYGPYRELLAYVLRHAGGLRLDHAMQVSRLWWIPDGASPDQGTYVGYDHAALLDILCEEATRVGAVLVGEDLGTVEPGFREGLAERRILGTSLLWFERDENGAPLPPERWRELSLATVGTHDMPPITGFLHGDHLRLRDDLGLLTRPIEEETDEHRRQLTEWLALLTREGLLQTADTADTAGKPVDQEVVAALHGLLARTPARLIGISLADVAGERRTQNQPGTTDEYPNWRVPLADAEGRPVLLDDLFTDPAVRAAIAPLLTS